MVKISSVQKLQPTELSRSVLVIVLDNPILIAVVTLLISLGVLAALWFNADPAVISDTGLQSSLPDSLGTDALQDPVWKTLTPFGERPVPEASVSRNLFVYPETPLPPEAQ